VGCANSSKAPALTSAALDLLTASGRYTGGEHDVTAAEQDLIHSCVTAKGFRYEVAVPTTRSPQDLAVDLPGRRSQGYGLYDRYAAGKNAAAAGTARQSSGSNDAYVRGLSSARAAAYTQVLRGAQADVRVIRMPGSAVDLSTKGCEADSRTRLFGSIVAYAQVTSIPQNLSSTLTAKVTHSSAYTALMRKWSACMTKKGYHLATPGEAQNALAVSYRKQGATQALHRREIATATADGACALTIGIPNQSIAIRKGPAPGTLTAQQRLTLAELSNRWKAVVVRAQRVMATTASESG
jgi:hypothetical protein